MYFFLQCRAYSKSYILSEIGKACCWEMSRGREVEMPIYRFFGKIWVCILEYGKMNIAANKNCQEYVFEA